MKRTTSAVLALLGAAAISGSALGQSSISAGNNTAWGENIGWTNWSEAGGGLQSVLLQTTCLSGLIWCENVGWLSLGDGSPSNGFAYANVNGTDWGVNLDQLTGHLSGYAWGENIGWVNFSGGAMAAPANPAQLDVRDRRLRGFVWGENIGWISLDDANHYVGVTGLCGSADFDGDGDVGTDLDIEAFFACLAGNCCDGCTADFNGDGDVGTDLDIEALFRVLGGGSC